jgi:hypothetical protein
MTPRIIHILLLTAWLLPAGTAWSQITIRQNTTMHARGLITINNSLSNLGTSVNLDEVQISLAGTTQELKTTTPLRVQNLTIAQGGTKTLSGNWEVSGTLSLTNGIVKIADDGKLLYSGTGTPEGNSGAFIDGYLFQNAGGRRFFPLGTRGTYAPAVIENAPANETGMRVLPSASELPLSLPPNVLAAYTDHYWEINGTAGSVVSLSTNGAESFLDGSIPTVLQADASGGSLTSLSGTISDTFITSIDNALQPLLLIGKVAEFQLVIHDLITPYNINVNDKLVIENIEKVEHNTVKLLDRWGVVVAEWKDFTNETEYDFTKLSPGNYVCLVQFNYPGESRTSTAKGMVTLLKSN